MRLPAGYFTRPFAHRGLHDRARGVIENSRAAIAAAAAAGWSIELDVQLSADGRAMVFHDHDLPRLTGAGGLVRARRAAELGAIRLKGGAEGIPTLEEILEIVDGRVPLVVEIKDQSLEMASEGVGPLEAAVVRALAGYAGPVAAMSFNPHSVAWLRDYAPGVARGFVSYDYSHPDDADVPAARRERLAEMEDAAALGVDFISYGFRSFPRAAAARLRAAGVPVLCWTIRSPEDEAFARRHADQITFEGYKPS